MQANARAIGRRLLQTVPVVVLATFMVFALLQLVPGDIAVTLAGDNASEARIVEIRALYGLDRPFLLQYADWLWNAAQGDLSRSLLSREAVVDSIARAFPHTLLIVVMALAIALLVGVPLGVAAASHRGGWIDRILMAVGSVGVAVPNFWLGMLLVSTFALQMNWFPATGAVAMSESFSGAVSHAFLPAVALAAGGVSEVMRQLRSSLVEIMTSQHVRTLHAKGLSPSLIFWKHGLKNVSVNLLTVTSLLFNRLLAATVVLEAVFAIPGLGSLVVNAAISRDFPIVQGVVLVMVLVVVAVNLATDLLYSLFDPRVR